MRVRNERPGAPLLVASSGRVETAPPETVDRAAQSKHHEYSGVPRSYAAPPTTGGVFSSQEGVHLSQSASDTEGFRTNSGLTNATGTATDAVIALYDAGGHHLGAVQQRLEPSEHIQIHRIFRKVAPTTIVDGYAIVSSSTPGAAFYADASVVDHRSGNPANIPAVC